MFLQASRARILRRGCLYETKFHWLQVYILIGGTLVLYHVFERYLECLQWPRSVDQVRTCFIFRQLGYPLGMNVTNVQLIEWMYSKLRDKFVYWKSQSWSFHILLKVVQCIWNLWYYIRSHCCHGQRRLCILSCNLFSIFVAEEEGHYQHHMSCVELSSNLLAFGRS